jgi:hypothetical protein
MSKFDGGSKMSVSLHSKVTVSPASVANTPNTIADQLIKKNFLDGDFSCMLPREKEAIRNSIKQALIIGANKALSVDESAYPGAQEMLDAAEEFEKTLPPNTNITREKASSYPWGWRYQDDAVREQYRLFYIANRKKG